MGGGHRDDSAETNRGAARAARADGLAAWAEASGRRPGEAGHRRRLAVRVLRAGVDRGLAGPGDVAGAAAGAGRGAGPRARTGRGGVLRRGAEPDGGVGTPPAGRRAGRRSWPTRAGAGTRSWSGSTSGRSTAASTRMMAPLFEHYGVQLWMPEAGGRVDFASEHDEQAMTVLGLSSKREVTRTSIRVRTAMAVQVREQGRYLGGRPPYGYRLGDAGPHPNKAHAAWGRRAHRLEPDPETAHVVRWIFAQRLAGHSVARIARALNEAGDPVPVGGRPGPEPAPRRGRRGRCGTVTTILPNPRYTGRQVWNRQRTDRDLADPADVSLGHKSVQRWNLPDGWVISAGPRTRRWSARPTSSPPRTSAPPGAPRPAVIRRSGASAGTCWPGCWSAGRAGGGWSRRGPTAGPPTAAATATPPPARLRRAGRRTPTSARTASCSWLPALHLLLTGAGRPRGSRRAPAAEPTSRRWRTRRQRSLPA